MLILKYFKIEKKLRLPCPPSSRVVFALKNQSEIKKKMSLENETQMAIDMQEMLLIFVRI